MATSPDGKYTTSVEQETYSNGTDSFLQGNIYVIDNGTDEKIHVTSFGGKYLSYYDPTLVFTKDSRYIVFSTVVRDDSYTSSVYSIFDLNNREIDTVIGPWRATEGPFLSEDSSKISFKLRYGQEFVYYIPTVTQITAAKAIGVGLKEGSGTIQSGQSVQLSFDLVAVTSIVSPEKITLTLNTGGIATYDAAASTLPSKIVFSYTVKADQHTSDLAIISINMNGSSIRGSDDKDAILTGATFAIPGRLKVDGFNGTTADESFLGTAEADIFRGGGGNDAYVVNNAADLVFEAKGQGSDRVLASLSYTLLSGQEIERLELSPTSGKANLNLTGNEFAQTLTGNAGANRLDGGGGADTLYGYAGDDIYVVDRATDQIFEARGQGNDAVLAKVSYTLAAGQEIERLYAHDVASTKALDLQGNAFAQTLRGNAGNNVLNGAGGIDTAIGGKGNDTYRVDNARDVVIERVNEGNDTLIATVGYTLAAGQSIETLRLAGLTGSANLNLAGNEFAQTLYGNAGNNVLDGKGGADTLFGGLGNDIYVVDNARDRVFEAKGQGTDTVVASTSYALAEGQEIERMQLAGATGTKNLNLTGNEFAQTLLGNAGNNVLDGKAGVDQLHGGAGNDTYVVENAADRVFEARGQGKDTVVTFTTYALAEGQEIEALQLAGATQFKNFDLTGNGFAQTLVGNAGNNVLDGRGGSDVLHGGKGQDSFVFSVAPSASNVDHIVDFAPVDDGIRLAKSVFSALAAGPLAEASFKDVGNAGATIDRDDRVIYDHRNGALYYDSNGSDAGNRTLIAVLDNKALLTHHDFFVV